jgi:hypothetical protein
MAHGRARRTLEAVLPSWQRLVSRAGVGARLVIISPEDDPLRIFEYDRRWPAPLLRFAGREQHWGPVAHERMKKYMVKIQVDLLEHGHDCVWLTEYDSLVLGDQLPFQNTEEDCVRGFRVENWDRKNNRMIEVGFEAREYFHWPLWFGLKSFLKFNHEFQKLGHNAERGLADRTIAAAIQRANLNTIPTNDIAFTSNFISHDQVVSLLTSINNGARLIHGFKIEPRKGLS